MADRLPSRAQPFQTMTPATMKELQFRMREDKSSPLEQSSAVMKWDNETQSLVANNVYSEKGNSKAVIESYNKSYETSMNNNRLQWKNHLNPLTLRYAAEVYPYGGGIAPARELGKHEITLSYLGSPAGAKLIALHQGEYGFESSERFQTTKEPTLFQDDQLKEQMISQLVSGEYDSRKEMVIPVLPYPIRTNNETLNPNSPDYFHDEGNFKLGTIEEAVRKNPDYWNQKIPGLDASDAPLDNYQKELIWREHIDKEVTTRLFDLKEKFPLNTDTYVPTLVPGVEPQVGVWNQYAEWDGEQSPSEFRAANTTMAPATHSMDDEGYVVSARAKELIGAIAADKTMIQNGLMPVDNPEETIDSMDNTLTSLRNGNQIYPNWRSVEGEYNPDSKYDIESAAWFWDGAADQCPEFAGRFNRHELTREWAAREQENAIKQGKWETNYLFPEFEPGLWSDVDTINKKYLDQYVEPDADINVPRDSYNHPRMVAIRENTSQGMSSAANLLATNNIQREEEKTYSEGRDSNTARHRMVQNMKIDMDKLYETNAMGNPVLVTKAENPEQGLIIEDFVKDPTWKEYAKVKGDLDNYTDQSGQQTRD